MATDPRTRRDVVRGDGERSAFHAFREARYGTRIGFRFADGRMTSLPYTHLVETEFDPDAGIILTFVGHRVALIGRNLADLALRFEEETVAEVFERHDHHGLRVAADAAFIERIEWGRI